MINLRFSLGGGDGPSLSDVENNLRDATSVLKRWGGFFRAKAKQRLAGLSGPDLASSTRERYATTAVGSVTKAGNVRSSYAKNLEAQLRKKTGGEMKVAELRRLARGGSTALSISDAQERSIERLRKRLEAARAKIRKQEQGRATSSKATAKKTKRKLDGHKLLGKLHSGLRVWMSAAVVGLRNRIPWSGAHNEGAKVGNGADLPARTTLEITQEDAAALARYFLDQITKGKRR